jgi:hypothetical protein
VTDEPPRTRRARAAAERALVRVVHHYGETPAFVLIGGLVPDLLCSRADVAHAGTTDIDIQVDLEIAAASVNAKRLEQALANAEFEPDGSTIWRWKADGDEAGAVVKFELLADLQEIRAGETIRFDLCDNLGAVNLRGTGWATRDIEPVELHTRIEGMSYTAVINRTGIAGYLLAKAFAARSRRKPKDWYDIAYVLLHADVGGPEDIAKRVLALFGNELAGEPRTALDDLMANFANPGAQGPNAYAGEMIVNHPDLDHARLRTDAVLGVEAFYRRLFVD